MRIFSVRHHAESINKASFHFCSKTNDKNGFFARTVAFKADTVVVKEAPKTQRLGSAWTV